MINAAGKKVCKVHPLLEKIEKPSRYVIGIMSGTSADGVDAALCRITGHGTASNIEQLAFHFEPFPPAVRDEILRLAGGKTAEAQDFCKMNFLLGQLYVDAAMNLCEEYGIAPEQIDLIGSHGQTFWHIPQDEPYLGYTFKSTLQLGECAVLAETFHCPVIGDFRVRDVAAGGLGAPLVPYSEFLIYRSEEQCVALQNIGGIGNITCLPPDCTMDQVLAFDTGPGNMVMDAVYSRLTNGTESYDGNGRFAARGKINRELLLDLMDDAYILRKPPKTTGREYYGAPYVDRVMAAAAEKKIEEHDLMATVTAFTAESIAYSVRSFLPCRPQKLIIGGGGSMNSTLVENIRQALPDCNVLTNEDIGFDSNAKEAVAFAVLANEALFAGTNSMPSVTGASHPVVMGKICL